MAEVPERQCRRIDTHDAHVYGDVIEIFGPREVFQCPGAKLVEVSCNDSITHERHPYLRESGWYECPGATLTVEQLIQKLSEEPKDGVVKFTTCCCGEGLAVNGKVMYGGEQDGD